MRENRRPVQVRKDAWEKARVLSEKVGAREGRALTLAEVFGRGIDYMEQAEKVGSILTPSEVEAAANIAMERQLAHVVKAFADMVGVELKGVGFDRGSGIMFFDLPDREAPLAVYRDPSHASRN